MSQKKALSLLAAGAAVFTGISATPAHAEEVKVADARVTAESQTPVPGAMTVGRVNIGNNAAAQAYLPAGTVFTVQFDVFKGTWKTGYSTLSTWYPQDVSISKIGPNTYRVVLKKDFYPGQQVPLDWSYAHWFDYGNRAKVTVSLDSIPEGTVDGNQVDNVATYDNGGRGF